MRKIDRRLFVPESYEGDAYSDKPLPIGHGQTISQPYIVAVMSQALELTGKERVLEIGTGSGYQAAVLGELAREVYTIEIVEDLAARSEALLRRLGYKHVHVGVGDGAAGWPDRAPFDAIIVSCAPEDVPLSLITQLKIGGRLVVPIGPSLELKPWEAQQLMAIRKNKSGLTREKLLDVRFVPMTRKR